MRAIAVSSALLLAATLVARTGRAETEELRLSWRAPEGCPGESQVREAAVRSASRGATVDRVEAEGRVERNRDRWVVTLRMTRAGVAAAERRLEASSCEALADAAAVILGLALVSPQREGATDDRAGSPKSDAPLATATAPAAPAVTSPGGPSDPDRTGLAADAFAHSLAASASLATDGTTLPSPALGGRAALAWTSGRGRVELGGAYFSEQSKTTGTSPAGATFALLVAGARGCWAVARGAVELSPCAGADVNIVKARGYGAAANYDASAAWLSASAGGLVRLPVTEWLALRGELDGVVPLSRPTFVVEGDGAVHRPAPLGFRGGIGAELLFL